MYMYMYMHVQNEMCMYMYILYNTLYDTTYMMYVCALRMCTRQWSRYCVVVTNERCTCTNIVL